MSLSSFLELIFLGVILAPPVEELLDRGVLYNFYKKKGILPALILSSAFFSLTHFSLHRVITIFIIGVFLALLYEITQCFWIPVLVHGSVNAIHTLLVVEPAVRVLKGFLYWLHGGNVWLFRIKLLVISIVLCILAIIVMFLIMRISGNNIFQGKEFKNIRVIKRDDDDPLIDKYLILVFVISVSIVVKVVSFKPV
ncbi:CPBP family intramembrane glutamic endopeptidase [Lutispora sp.]|uniref:CPBP family intramembrane glutamic endopeptidase n=1 Tax=Lutispora sp. TaxID=2828727 RepID=UPI002B217D04|nr:CPBP family intramembrane glutamic endopeptidase [Lutispora sp.]MEA4962654.1 CPBP family intramembrane glutamic endopeptidase [Lutispora sp.]